MAPITSAAAMLGIPRLRLDGGRGPAPGPLAIAAGIALAIALEALEVPAVASLVGLRLLEALVNRRHGEPQD